MLKKSVHRNKLTSKGKKSIWTNTLSRIDLWIISMLVLLFLGIFTFSNNFQNKQQTYIQAAGTNPMLYGTNLTLNDANDQFLTSSQTRTAMQQIHVTTVRMPIRSVGAPSQAEIQAAQDIKSINAVPLVILKFTQPDPQGAGISVVQAMNQVFGNSTVYYEFGNERDLAGVNQNAYTAAWNQFIPAIKAAAANGKFGGPVNFQTNPGYIAYFVQNANPAPDFISWHEYTCGNSESGATCIANISHWSTHIANTKSAISATGKAVPPIFITEWNYDPNNPPGDPRATPQFQQQFVTTALQELNNDGVAAAYQFVVTGHTEYNLIDPSGQITAAGQAFGQIAGQNMGTGSTITPPVATPTFVCTGGMINGICGTPPPISGTSLSPSPVPSSMPSAFPSSITPTVTSQGKAICSSDSNKSCSYTDDCSAYSDGITCEKQINGCGNNSSGNNVYICKNGKWTYDHWVKQGEGQCAFCGGTTNPDKESSIRQLLVKLLELLRKLFGF